MVSYPPATYPGLVLIMVAGVQERKWKYAHDCPTGQSKSYGQALSWGRIAYPKRMDLGRHEQMGATSLSKGIVINLVCRGGVGV